MHISDATNRKHLGRSGEEIAARFLLSKGFVILERNWRHGRLEIDLISRLGGQTVFVEVKTGDQRGVCSSMDYLRRPQIDRIKKAASAYAWRNGLSLESCRFDLLAVSIDSHLRSAAIRHFEDIF